MLEPLSTPTLPRGIRARFVDNINGLRMHVLEAGFEQKGRPCLLLLHGFPELAYSWRKVMLPLAAAGYHVVAPDLRGYGRTTGWDGDYDGDLGSFRMLNTVRDIVGLVSALGYRSVAGVVGHDYGSPVSGWCALVRPDIFRTVTLMSAPFPGPPAIPFATADAPPAAPKSGPTIHDDLAALTPPRKHYHWYYSTRPANADMTDCPQGIHAFLRAYYHHKSADWKANKPHKLAGWIASELAQDADLLRHGAGQDHAAVGGAAHAERRRDRRLRVAARRGARRLRRRVRPDRLPGRPPELSDAHQRPFRGRAGSVRGPNHRPAVLLHRGQERLGRLPGPRCVRAYAGKDRARACWPATSSMAPATGCSRSSRRPPCRLLLDFLRKAGTN